MEKVIILIDTVSRFTGTWLALLVAGAMLGFVPRADAQDFTPGGYYWYVPEHEKYGRTAFYSQPRFDSAQVRITRTLRFKYGPGRKGWVLLEFDGGVRAFIHLRILRVLLHNPAASDPWYEFQRASVFPEEPEKIEARLKPASPSPQASDSKVPAWKRYKEGWGLNKGRTPQAAAPDNADSSVEPGTSRPAEKKSRNRYPLLPPIGSQPAAEEGAAADGESPRR